MRLALRAVLEACDVVVEETVDFEANLSPPYLDSLDAVVVGDTPDPMTADQTISKIRLAKPTLPIVVVSATVDGAFRNQVLHLGASEFLPKPFENKEFLHALERCFKEPLISTPKESFERPALGPSVHGQAEKVTFDIPSPPSSQAGEKSTKRHFSPWLIVGLALVAGTWVLYRWQNQQRAAKLHHDYRLPYSNPADMSWHDGKLWILDWLSQTVYVQDVSDANVSIVQALHLPIAHVSGMTVTNSGLYTSDGWAKKIRLHRLDASLSVQKEYSSPGPSPASLFWDGHYLWSVDSQEHRIYQHEPQTLAVIATYPTPGNAPAGFYKDEKFAWTMDSRTRRLYQHRLDSNLSVLQTYSLPEFEEGAEPLSCFLWQADTFWFARDRKALLFRRDKRLLTPR